MKSIMGAAPEASRESPRPSRSGQARSRCRRRRPSANARRPLDPVSPRGIALDVEGGWLVGQRLVVVGPVPGAALGHDEPQQVLPGLGPLADAPEVGEPAVESPLLGERPVNHGQDLEPFAVLGGELLESLGEPDRRPRRAAGPRAAAGGHGGPGGGPGVAREWPGSGPGVARSGCPGSRRPRGRASRRGRGLGSPVRGEAAIVESYPRHLSM